MLHADYGTQFKRDLKLAQKRGNDILALKEVMRKLCEEDVLPVSNKDHPLSGEWKNHRECHIQPDWLLIYFIDRSTATIRFVRNGTHSDLF